MVDLTREEIVVLIEAVDAWVNKDFAGEMMGDIMTAMLVKGEEEQAKFKAEREQKNKLQEEVKEHRKEQATLLKAKLIQIKNSMM